MKRTICAALVLALLLCGCAAGSSDTPTLLEPISINDDMATAVIGNMYDGSVIEGKVLPETVSLSFETTGTVSEICAVIGDQVQAGDPLVKLDTTALQAQRDRLAADLEYAETMDGFASRESELNLAAMQLQSGENSARYKLFESEQAEAARQRRDTIDSLRAQLDEVETALNVQSVLTAPCAGTVAAINVNIGARVLPDAVIAVIANNDNCYLQCDFMSQSSVSAVSELYATIGGLRYEVEYIPMDASEYISKSLSGETLYSTFHIKDAEPAMIGQYALLYLMSAQREQVLNVPANAVLRDTVGYYVYVDDGSGGKLRRDVTIGLKTAAQVEILSGLEEGVRVYVVG